jgi:putative phage-type endonuclease
LWEEKTLGWEQEINDVMRRGQEMEHEARECYEKLSGLKVKPQVAECEINPFLSASFDGITDDDECAVEIKCGKSSHHLARNNFIPTYYYAQLQHQMMIAELWQIDYFSYSRKDQFLITVSRDKEFIKEMIEKEVEFWNNVINFWIPK